MNRSVWSNICLDGCTAGHLSSLQPVPMLSGASITLQEDRKSIKMRPQRAYYSSHDAGSSLICSSQLELSPSRNTEHSSTRRHQSPASSSCGYHDWNLKSGRHAKRARVESIIKGMSSSPVMHCTDLKTNSYKESDDTQDNERIQGSPLYEDRRAFVSTDPRQTTRQHLESQHQHLREYETRLNLVEAVTNPTDRSDDEKYPTWNNSPETPPKDTFADSYHELESSASRKHQGWKKVKVMNYVQSKPERIKLMADVLKFELSRAVSRSVDSIFKSMSFLQTLPNDGGSVETGMPLQSPVCKDNESKIVSGVQTEALSLVIQKPQLERADENILQSKSRDHQHPKPTVRLNHESALHEEELPDKNLNTAWQHARRRLQDAYSVAGHEMCHAYWSSVKVRTKVNSRSVRSPKTRAVSADPMILPSLYLPHVKIESDSLVNNNLCMLNEGLTTSHLKKAKLMFFYTRYPSSLVLKLCFQDVKFTRCITSQLIKWFSNFREFFYIQMEKFARHAFIEGVADVRRLTVGRESELFRALNMHFNKANDFQVPDRFLEVAEITLREFYIAISVGKDRDPSWKKAIYKVICKLDSDVPAELKNYHFSLV